MFRNLLFALVGLAPVTIVIDHATAIGDVPLFVLSALSLIPLAWLIGESTDHVAEHTGPGVGGFLNATFGNAPELIIALIALHHGLTEVVRGSLTGSVVGNLLLVLGFSLLAGGDGTIERWSSFLSFTAIGVAIALFLVPAIPSWTGDPNRTAIARLSAPIALALLIVYAVMAWYSLRRHHTIHVSTGEAIEGWSFRRAIAALTVATILTALVAQILVGTLEAFANRFGLTDFFVAAVIVATVGNAAEHGGAVIVAYRGKIQLAAEIALASAAQVAVFLIPAVALLSWLVEPLALAFRQVEILALAVSLAAVIAVLWTGRSSRLRGVVLILAYVGVAVAFYFAGDRTTA